MYELTKLPFRVLLFILILTGLNNCPVTHINNQITDTSSFNLFANDEMIDICIETDIEYLLNNRYENCSYQTAKIYYFEKSDCSKILLNVKVKPRGHFRLNPKYCKFPPIKIKFLDTNLKDALFRNQITLKLVTHKFFF